ncbi:hypothetical protein VTK26DRAFT_2694 [Humicola hyalothermophila]
MELLRLVLLSTALVGVSSSPVASPQQARDAHNERREALNLDSNPAPMDTVILNPLPTRGCTTTVSEIYSFPCSSWSSTTTIYPSTVVATRQVDCHGCDVLSVYKEYYHCPNLVITATESARTPSTIWTTVCQPSPTLNRRDEGAAATQAAPIVAAMATPA